MPVVSAEWMPSSLPRPRATARAGKPGLDTETSLLYTSGTTGRPKGCILSNLYYLNAGAWYRDLGGLFRIEHGRERILNPLPLFHMNAQAVTATCAMLTANCLIQPERFSPSRWWTDVASSRATIIHYLGVMLPLLLKQPPSPEDARDSGAIDGTGVIAAGNGDDQFTAYGGAQLFGEDGNDTLAGSQADGGAGADRINGTDGNDELHGGADNERQGTARGHQSALQTMRAGDWGLGARWICWTNCG